MSFDFRRIKIIIIEFELMGKNIKTLHKDAGSKSVKNTFMRKKLFQN